MSKIYNKIVLDMNTWAVLEEDSYLYEGPMALCEGAGDQGDDDKSDKADKAEKTYSEAYVEGLRKEAAARRVKVKELEEKLATFDGIDPEEVKKLIDAQKDAEKKKLEQKGEWEKLKEQMVEAHQKELAKKEKELEALSQSVADIEKELESTILANAIAQEAAISKAINPKVLQLIMAQEAKVEKLEDGSRVVKIYKDGNVRVDLKTGEPLTIRQRLEEMKQSEEYAMLFEGGTYGAGSRTSNNNAKGVNNPFMPGKGFNLTEQGRLVRENPTLAKTLADAAGVKLNIQ